MSAFGRTGRALHGVTAIAVALLVGAVSQALADGASGSGSSFARVMVSGQAELRPLVKLGLATDTLTFDLRGDAAAGPLCVMSANQEDTVSAGSPLSDPYVLPAGTELSITSYPRVEVAGGRVLQGPLAVVPPGSAVVCYRTFIMTAFSNTDGWQVTVDRYDLPGTPTIEHLYLAAACRDDPDLAGMSAVSGERQVTLVRDRAAGTCSDVVVVAALKVGSEPAGTSAVGLRYTLLSAGGAIGGTEASASGGQ